jgi:hypothetical protein
LDLGELLNKIFVRGFDVPVKEHDPKKGNYRRLEQGKTNMVQARIRKIRDPRP